MSGPSKVIVLDPDPRAGRQLQLGFEREGVVAMVTPVGVDLDKLALHADDAGLIVVGGTDGRGLELLAKTRALLDDGGHDLPIVFAGRGVRRSEAELAGADEVLLAPAHLRDVVTVGRILRGLPAKHRAHIVGSLAETTGVYTLVRALAAIGRSAVLTLIRGLRRGEVRFYHGEVTSAQVGMIHGQAALHQLLLWTDARFDYQRQDVVRRQQIPLTHEELFADAERFLVGVRESAGALSPAMVLEQNVARVQTLGKQIPTEVHGVLRMFDGHRVLADVLEDSPYRVFETLRVAQRAMEAGLLKVAPTPRPKATWRAVLAIEEWLVGTETRDGVVERTASMLDSQPVDPHAATGPTEPPRSPGASPPYSSTKSRKKRGNSKKKGRANTPLPSSVPVVSVGGGKQEIDWGALVPRIVGAEVGPLAGVVPAMMESGEILSRREAREGLEAVTDTAMRAKIFPTELDGEPTVVWNEAAERAAVAAEAAVKMAAATAARDAAEAEGKAELAAKQARIKELVEKQRRELEQKAAAAAAAQKTEAEAKTEAVAAAKAKTEAEAAAAAKTEAAAAAKAKTEAEAAAAAKAKTEAEAAAAFALAAQTKAVAAAKAEAEAAAKAEAEAAAKAIADAATKAEAEAAARAKAEADAAAAAVAAKAVAEAAKAAAVAEAAKAAAEAAAAKAAAAAEAAKAEAAKAAAEAVAAKAAAVAEAAKAAAVAEAAKAAAVADAAKAETEAQAKAEADARADALRAVAPSVVGDARPAPVPPSASELVKQILAEGHETGDLSHRVRLTDPVTVVETPGSTVVTSDKLTVVAAKDMAVVTSTPHVTITATAAAAAPATPSVLVDEPSDGVIQAPLINPETAPLARPRRVSTPPPGGYPEPQPAQRGEIPTRIADASKSRPLAVEADQPSVLVADLAAAQQAIAAVTSAQARAPATADATTTTTARAVAQVRSDAAVAFTDAEEAFFRGGDDKAAPVVRAQPAESFEDLDADYKPVGFWDRVRGRNRHHSATSDPPLKSKEPARKPAPGTPKKK